MTKIFLDPGHGGCWPHGDPGAVNGSYYESSCNLQIALRLRDALTAYDAEVMLSRSDDSCPSLSARAAMANEWAADYYFSIHANAGSPWASGTLAVLQLGRTKNGELLLADMLTEAISDALEIPQRPISYQDVAVLRETTMPAVLLEVAFISNSEDCSLLFDAMSQIRVADAISRTLALYFGMALKNPALDPFAEDGEWAIKRGISDGTRADDVILRKEVWAMLRRLEENRSIHL